jgi:hypothetical protein
MTLLRQVVKAIVAATDVVFGLIGVSDVFPRAPSVGGQDEASETNSKPSDWTGYGIQQSIWENEGLEDCRPPACSATSAPIQIHSSC